MNDTNDSIQHVSDTALWVATYRADETRRPDALFQDPLAETLAGERGKLIAARMPHAEIMRWVLSVRTVAIDRLIQSALRLRVDTVVNLGAGLDTRPYRMDLPASLRWFEVDFPSMIQYKSEKLKNEKPHCQLERLSVDLSDALQRRKALEQIAAQAKKILVITEGVTPYLDKQEVADLAHDLLATQPIHYWILDHRRGSVARIPKRIRRAMKDVPFKLDLPDELGFIQQQGWQLEDNIDAFAEAHKLKRPFPVGFPWNMVRALMPGYFSKRVNRQTGYALLRRQD